MAAAVAAALASASPAGAGPPLAPVDDSASAWIDRMLAAQRLGDTSAARLDARTLDHTGSGRDFTLEWLRDARGEVVTSVIEAREEGTPTLHVFRFETQRDGSLACWSWDVKFQRFVRVMDLDGSEPFAGTHVRLEDLGFTGLAPRRSATVAHAQERGARVVSLTTGPHRSYGRVVTRLDEESALPVSTDIFDGTGALIWRLGYRDVARVGGRPFVTRIVAGNPISEERSEIVWRAAAVGVRLTPEQLLLEYLDTQMRRGAEPVELPPGLQELNGPLPPAKRP
jgi:hypothetical protein